MRFACKRRNHFTRRLRKTIPKSYESLSREDNALNLRHRYDPFSQKNARRRQKKKNLHSDNGHTIAVHSHFRFR